ncbi:MAG: hypothetical protein WDO56_35195 [Gammaproteobacteria bacterium]
MAKIKDILIHVIVETALKRRKCHRNKTHAVKAGETCMVVKDGMYKRNYCVTCAAEILGVAKTRLSALRQQLGIAVSG